MDGTVYLLHFQQPYTSPNGAKTIRHYIGWASNVERRLAHHQAGTGARVMAAVCAAGIAFTLARTWPGDKTLERRLKRQHNHADLCPLCREEKRHA